MEFPGTTVPSITYLLRNISDDKALILFKSIAISNGDKYIPLREINLTTKQYYSRISGLIAAGLIRRHRGRYFLTLLGKVVYYSQMTIGKTLSYYWKLRVIDSIGMSSDTKLREEEIIQLIDALVDDHTIKDILIKPISSGYSKERKTVLLNQR
jgi:hypothetical protein